MAASVRSAGSRPTIRPAQYASSIAKSSLKPAQMTTRVVRALAREAGHGVEVEERAEHDLRARRGRRHDRAGAVRRREDQRLRARLEELARRGARVEPVDPLRVALAAGDRGVAELLPQRPRVVDLRAAEDTLVARRERLGDRRRRTHQVDDDAELCRGCFRRREGDVEAHGRKATGAEGGARLTADVDADALLPPPGPGDLRLLLGLRPPDLHRVHDAGARRPALPRALGQGAWAWEGSRQERGGRPSRARERS